MGNLSCRNSESRYSVLSSPGEGQGCYKGRKALYSNDPFIVEIITYYMNIKSIYIEAIKYGYIKRKY